MAADKENKQGEELKKDEYESLADEMMKYNNRLKVEIQVLEAELQVDTRDFQFREDFPEKKMKFLSIENPEDDSKLLNASCAFQVKARVPYLLKRGQALITFESEEVAQNVIRMGKHSVQIEDEAVEVKAQPVQLNSGVTFQVHVQLSDVKINVTGIPDGLPAEQMRDKLELSFSKSRNGGGEVECVEYDHQSRSAIITFVESGVAGKLLKKDDYPLYINQKCYRVMVSPYIEKHLEKFQVFSGTSSRTVLLTGMEHVSLDEETLEDFLSIHFQRGKNGGGEVDVVKCSLVQAQIADFEEETDSHVKRMTSELKSL
ncbi:N-myc-interactor [Echinops telfairi]|uniref:N-myc-interactor n=2 Tax=Echinops telfairi TaxID=9371 RepID=A0ABM0INA9_ECHTE|nr:N-myc-interactor [Echinops telfairi]XP_045155666.1 N-myc-interactor [Echinops telfairi]